MGFWVSRRLTGSCPPPEFARRSVGPYFHFKSIGFASMIAKRGVPVRTSVECVSTKGLCAAGLNPCSGTGCSPTAQKHYFLIMGLFAYGFVMVGLGLYTPEGISRWVTAESTGIVGVQGTTRAIFGLARSFINMGDDAVLFKRFLLHDQ